MAVREKFWDNIDTTIYLHLLRTELLRQTKPLRVKWLTWLGLPWGFVKNFWCRLCQPRRTGWCLINGRGLGVLPGKQCEAREAELRHSWGRNEAERPTNVSPGRSSAADSCCTCQSTNASHEFHGTCHSVTFIVLVNSHQRWKQTRNRVCFHLWCELTLALWCHSIVWSIFSWNKM